MAHQSTSSAGEAAAAHAHDEPHLIPYSTYILVWLGLCLLTIVTVGVAQLDMRHMAIPVALIVASVKCTLVILWFMHIKFENKVLWWFLIAGIGTYVIFVILTFADYAYR